MGARRADRRPRRRGKGFAGIAAALALLAPAPAGAAGLDACGIIVLDAGAMVPDPVIGTLDSALPGGSSARVQVNVISLTCWLLHLIGCYRVSAPPPASFQAYPAGGDSGVTFSTSYRVDDGSLKPGTAQTEVVDGPHIMTVDLAAARASGIFPAGAYQAQVIVRCE